MNVTNAIERLQQERLNLLTKAEEVHSAVRVLQGLNGGLDHTDRTEVIKGPPVRARGKLSAAGKARIAAAQRKRWAKIKKAK